MDHSHLLNDKLPDLADVSEKSRIGSPMTLDQIARLAGTSKSTVSRVISNDPRISEKTRSRVQQIIDQRHYRPNLFARALAGGKTGLIGVISSNIGSGFYAEVIRGIDLVFHRDSKRLLVSFAHYENDYEALWRDLALGGRVEGLVLIAPTAEFFALPLAPALIPVIVCAGDPPARSEQWRGVDRVGMDNAEAMRGLIDHLVEQGCRRLFHAAGWDNNHDAVERRRAFIKACRKRGIEHEVEVFGMTTTDGEQSMNHLLRNRNRLPDAIIAFNDAVAIGIRDAWKLHHRDDARPSFALTGWDDSPAAIALDITSVSIPFTQLGELSARLLKDRIAGVKAEPPRYSPVGLELRLRSSSHVPPIRRRRKTS